jgi:hypothetical protein
MVIWRQAGEEILIGREAGEDMLKELWKGEG